MLNNSTVFTPLFFAVALCSLFLGCGRYLKPLPPEAFAPQAVRDLIVHADTNGVIFDWKSPELDRRGKELKTLDGYDIYRKVIENPADVVSRDVEPDKIASISDLSVATLTKTREEARAQGKIGRRIKADSALQSFTFTDATAEPGKEYLYTLIPINQGDVKGAPGVPIRVLFRGEASEISFVKGDLLERLFEQSGDDDDDEGL